MEKTDLIYALEYEARSKGITSYTEMPDFLFQDFSDSLHKKQESLQNILALPEDSIELVQQAEKKGLTEAQYRCILSAELENTTIKLNELKKLHELPSYEFVNFISEEYANAAYYANQASQSICKLQEKIKNQKFIIIGLILFNILFCGIPYILQSIDNREIPSLSTSSTFSTNSVPSSTNDTDKDANLIAKPYPENGAPLYNYCTPSKRVAPLEIQTSGDKAYCIKLVSQHNPNDYIFFFIRPGETAEYLMPLGDFELRYASGDTWYGLSYLFGSDTVYSKSDDILSFTFDGEYYNGHTITLYPVSNGNMSTEIISADEF